jgi:hypothetical protein
LILRHIHSVHQFWEETGGGVSPFVKDEKDGEADASEACGVIPFKLFTKVDDGKNGKDGKCNYFLNRLELRGGKFVRADTICGHLEAVFEKRDSPTGEDNFPKRFATIFQVAVPGKSHKDIGNREKKNRAHEVSLPWQPAF